MATATRSEWANVRFVVKEGVRREKSDPPNAYVLLQTSDVSAKGPGLTRFLDGMIGLHPKAAMTVEEAQRVASFLNEHIGEIGYTEFVERGPGH
jgi:hypothetical protein